MSTWIKLTTLSAEVIYLNMPRACRIDKLTNGSRVRFDHPDANIAVQETPDQILRLIKEAQAPS